MADVLPFKKPSIARLECSKCGAGVDAACNCNAPYLPAAQRAAEAIEQNPARSNRVIAAEIGVDEKTVRKARSTADSPQLEKRVGKDGKARKLPAKQDATIPTKATGDLATEPALQAERNAAEPPEEIEVPSEFPKFAAADIEALIKPILDFKAEQPVVFANLQRYGCMDIDITDGTLALYDRLEEASQIISDLANALDVTDALHERWMQKEQEKKDRIAAIRAEWKEWHALHPTERYLRSVADLLRWHKTREREDAA